MPSPSPRCPRMPCPTGPQKTCNRELEFLYSHPCVADVVAITDVKTVRLHRDHFEMCMGPVAGFLKDRSICVLPCSPPPAPVAPVSPFFHSPVSLSELHCPNGPHPNEGLATACVDWEGHGGCCWCCLRP